MKKVYLFMFIGILAIILVIITLMNFDPKVETWSSFLAGVAIAFLLLKLKLIIAYFKNRKLNSQK